jgi:hypothetical protein
MYGVVEKSVNELTIFKQQKEVAQFLGVSTATIRRKNDLTHWETEKYIVYNPVNVYAKRSYINQIGNIRRKFE